MIVIDRLANVSISLDKKIIPPQLDPVWARIIDSDKKICYAIYDSDLKEQINFCISEFSFGKILTPLPYASYGTCFDINNSLILKKMFEKLERFAVENDCLSMSVSTHPLSSVPFVKHRDIFEYDYSFTNFCQISDVSVHPVVGMTHHRRMAFNNEISKMTVQNEWYIDKNPTKELFDRWFEIYLKKMKLFGSIPLPYEFYYKYWQESLRNKIIDFWMITNGEDVIGGVFFAVGKNIIDYCTSLFDEKYSNLNPTTYLLNQYFYKMMDAGIQYFNWQSSPVRNGGVYNYKKRWGSKEYEHYYFSKILCNIDDMVQIPLDIMKRETVGHYVIPYSVWGEELMKGTVTKNDQ